MKTATTKKSPYGMVKYQTIDEYHATFPESLQGILNKLRKIIKQAAPQAVEVISYNMPAFKQGGVLVYYAGYKNHIGFYPTAAPIEVFKSELKNYKTSKGAIQFTVDKPLPEELIKQIVKFRVEEDIEKRASKKTARICKNGHKYFKSSDCPTCPICENEQKPESGFLSLISAPARRALESKGIKTLKELSSYSEKEILQLHGIGPKAIPTLKNEMKKTGLKFKNN